MRGRRIGALLVAAALVGAFGPASGAAPRDSEPRFPTHWQGDEETAFEAHICSWSYIDACSEDMQRWMVKSLLTDASKLFPAMKQNALALLDPQPGERVLDVACGIGDDVRTIANVVGPSGHVVGMDASKAMLRVAKRRAEQDANSNTEFVHGSSYHLSSVPGFGSFDAARIERSLQHLQRPTEAISEMIRAVRPGGRIMAVEVDWGTIAVDHPDHSLTQHILDATQGLVAQPWAGRELRNWFKRAGLRHVRVRPVAVATTSLDAARFDEQVKTIATDGFLERDVVEQWLEELREMADEGQFLYSVTAYLAVGTKRGHRHRGLRHRAPSGHDEVLGRDAEPGALAPRPAPLSSPVDGESSRPPPPAVEARGEAEEAEGEERPVHQGEKEAAAEPADSDADDGAEERGHQQQEQQGNQALRGSDTGSGDVSPSDTGGGSGSDDAPAANDTPSADDGSGSGSGSDSDSGSGSGSGSDSGSGGVVEESGVAVADEAAPPSGSGSSTTTDDQALSRVPQPGANRHVAAEEDELEWSEEADEAAEGGFTAEPVEEEEEEEEEEGSASAGAGSGEAGSGEAGSGEAGSGEGSAPDAVHEIKLSDGSDAR